MKDKHLFSVLRVQETKETSSIYGCIYPLTSQISNSYNHIFAVMLLCVSLFYCTYFRHKYDLFLFSCFHLFVHCILCTWL